MKDWFNFVFHYIYSSKLSDLRKKNGLNTISLSRRVIAIK